MDDQYDDFGGDDYLYPTDDTCTCDACEGFAPPKTIDVMRDPATIRDELLEGVAMAGYSVEERLAAEEYIEDAYKLMIGEIPAKGERVDIFTAFPLENQARQESKEEYRARQRKGQTKPVGDVQPPVPYPSLTMASLHAAHQRDQILQENPGIAEIVRIITTQPEETMTKDNDWHHHEGDFGPDTHAKPQARAQEEDETYEGFGCDDPLWDENPSEICAAAASEGKVLDFPSTLDQPEPVANDSDAVWPQVVDELWGLELPVPPTIIHALEYDMLDRHEVGIKRYGTALQPYNGRDALTDAYAEALDQTVYLKQAFIEADDDVMIQEIDDLYVESVNHAARLLHLITVRDGLSRRG